MYARLYFTLGITDAKMGSDNLLVLKLLSSINVIFKPHMTGKLERFVASLRDMGHFRDEHVGAIHVGVLVKTSWRTVAEKRKSRETLLVGNFYPGEIQIANLFAAEF